MKRILIMFFITSSHLLGGEAGAIFLLISPSPLVNGIGGSGVSFISNDVYSSFFNPAHSKLPNGLSYQSSKISTEWLPNLADDLIFENEVKRISYNKYPLSNSNWLEFSITKLETNLNLGEQMQTDANGNELGNFNSYMSCSAITYSVGVQSRIYPISFSIGRTDKTAIQNLGTASSKDKFYDWGFRFSANNYPLLDNKIGLTFGLGYSKSNIGDFIWFQDESQADPAPMTARLGMTWGGKIKLIDELGLEIKLTHEGQDLLVETIDNETVYQKSLLGDLDINDHILSSDAEEGITIHRGMEINFFDIYFSRTGKLIDIDGKMNINTRGNSINYTNLMKLFLKTININNSYLNNFTKYISYQKSFSSENEDQGHPRDNIKYREHTLTLKNVDELVSQILK